MKPGDLTTLDALKGWLDIKGNEFDDELERLITAISAFVKNWIGRSLNLQVFEERRDGSGSGAIMLNQYPVVAVTSVNVDGFNVSPQQYDFDEYGLYLSGAIFTRGKNNVRIIYSAGFSVIPADLEQAVIETAALRWKEKGRIGMSSKALAGETTTFIVSDFPPSAKSIMNAYKRVTLS